jgi:hypothetical protein
LASVKSKVVCLLLMGDSRWVLKTSWELVAKARRRGVEVEEEEEEVEEEEVEARFVVDA